MIQHNELRGFQSLKGDSGLVQPGTITSKGKGILLFKASQPFEQMIATLRGADPPPFPSPLPLSAIGFPCSSASDRRRQMQLFGLVRPEIFAARIPGPFGNSA